MERSYWRRNRPWYNFGTNHHVNLGRPPMIEKLRRIVNKLWSPGILALILAIMILITMKKDHHHTQERLNEMQDIINQGIPLPDTARIPTQPSPPVELEPECQ